MKYQPIKLSEVFGEISKLVEKRLKEIETAGACAQETDEAKRLSIADDFLHSRGYPVSKKPVPKKIGGIL